MPSKHRPAGKVVPFRATPTCSRNGHAGVEQFGHDQAGAHRQTLLPAVDTSFVPQALCDSAHVSGCAELPIAFLLPSEGFVRSRQLV